MTDRPPIPAGSQLTTAVLGLPLAGVVRLWTDRPSTWRVRDYDALLSRLGTGSIARTATAPHRYREAAFLDAANGQLLIQARNLLSTNDQGYSAEGFVVDLEPADLPQEDLWDELRATLSRIALHAIQRGEAMVVELGGWDPPVEPYCLATALVEDGEARSVVETAPAVSGSEFWPEVGEQPGQTLSAPLTEDTVSVIGILAADALLSWGVHPCDLAITYAPMNPA
ncbi:hypothetical protein [Tsukamurella ocularis]|uniref:hypothetical protein n=1 Tax=Tsukamurella ocularis TaxID=1970234 RepID=UPI0021697CC3|nr:hypothetical protein [Tsukamurella ocularis]MCS3781152.1 hypothetical protein [Tsukamurella ocularis]MCS3786976.1 hypothetical protein [Tsukamurella ocularis]MCS3850818.1 hypothetical protein [Tsukamurella ocularis]